MTDVTSLTLSSRLRFTIPPYMADQKLAMNCLQLESSAALKTAVGY